MFARLHIPPSGDFWSMPHLIDATDAEIAAINENPKAAAASSDARIQAIIFALNCALLSLHNRPPAGSA